MPVLQGKFNVQRIDRFIKDTTARRMAAVFRRGCCTAASGEGSQRRRARTARALTALFVDADFKASWRSGDAQTAVGLPDPGIDHRQQRWRAASVLAAADSPSICSATIGARNRSCGD